MKGGRQRGESGCLNATPIVRLAGEEGLSAARRSLSFTSAFRTSLDELASVLVAAPQS